MFYHHHYQLTTGRNSLSYCKIFIRLRDKFSVNLFQPVIRLSHINGMSGRQWASHTASYQLGASTKPRQSKNMSLRDSATWCGLPNSPIFLTKYVPKLQNYGSLFVQRIFSHLVLGEVVTSNVIPRLVVTMQEVWFTNGFTSFNRASWPSNTWREWGQPIPFWVSTGDTKLSSKTGIGATKVAQWRATAVERNLLWKFRAIGTMLLRQN